MTQENWDDRNNAEGTDYRETPSQAEGDRETVEQDLREMSGQSARPVAGGGELESTPSQAEGDRETIERDIEEKSKQQC